MKMILAIVQDIDAETAVGALTEAKHRVTRIASTGGFFRQGNSTLLCAVEDAELDDVVAILRKVCQQRTRVVPVSIDPSEAVLSAGTYTEVAVGGATVLVFDVERFEHF
jgi:uncharacterized protein YaaQ